MSDQHSTTVIETIAPEATSQPVRKKRGRKKEPRDQLGKGSEFSFLNQQEEPEETESIFEEGVTVSAVVTEIKNWITTAIAAGYGISLLIHAIILLLMSFYMLSDISFDDAIQSTITTAEEATVFDELMDVRIDMPEGDVAFEKSLESAMNMEMADWAENPITTGVEESIESLFDKEGSKGLGGSGFLAPQNARVFKKGSFSAWTVPNDPAPGQDYVIVIVVKLPQRVKRYRASDLSGIVVGTDGYKQPIPGPAYTRGKVFLPMKDKMVQMKVTVPGGRARVRDVIDIRSTMLKEKQRIKLEF